MNPGLPSNVNPDQVYLGFDIGSVSLNSVVMDREFKILGNYYDYLQGRPFTVLYDRLEAILREYPARRISFTAFTGSGGRLGAELCGGVYVNEIIAQATSSARLYPDVRSVIEIGGEDSKLIWLSAKDGDGKSSLADFEMNSICAAGTGSFLDQQARRIGVPIENEFGKMALLSEDPPRIAGRCSVFAKSDMIHHQQ
nr:hypothetical protein [Bacteroidales bacterium]